MKLARITTLVTLCAALCCLHAEEALQTLTFSKAVSGEKVLEVVLTTKTSPQKAIDQRASQGEMLFGKSSIKKPEQEHVRSIRVNVAGHGAVTFPDGAVTDLFRPGAVMGNLGLVYGRGKVYIEFKGGDGERGYTAKYELNLEDGTLRRSIYQRPLHPTGFRSEWKIEGMSWRKTRTLSSVGPDEDP